VSGPQPDSGDSGSFAGGAGAVPTGPARLTIELPATHEDARVARDLVKRLARLRGVGQAEADTLALVAAEMLSNAVDHRSAERDTERDSGRELRMQLAFELDERAWTLEVADQGGGDPAALQAMLDSGELPDAGSERGRGMFLLHAMTDEIEVRRSRDGRGLAVRALKLRAGHGPG
jgi:anti-sigma regulatory factor (Ser/Thr protein kinase)